jgi:Bacterial Ig domain/Calx-beta domain
MKGFRCCLKGGKWFVLSLAILSCGVKVSAQTDGIVPVVSVQATQPIATVTNSGVFTVFRAGNTDETLNVWYDLGGTASNGVDYATIPEHFVTIPAGTTSNTIVIALTNPPPSSFAKTVVLTLTNSPLLTPVNYQIGSPSQAEVIVNNFTNPTPWVEIVIPTNGETFTEPTNIFIEGRASEWGFFSRGSRYVTLVQFFAGTNRLGEYFIPPPFEFGGTWPPPQIVWTNPPPGNFVLTAIATDNGGVSATSAPVNITVQSSNLPPSVSIFVPQDGAMFYTPTNIQIVAKANDLDGSISNVEFFAGATDLGSGTPVVLDPLVGGGVSGLVYLFNWTTNVSPGNYPLTAVATDNSGASTTSAIVNISVLQGPPPNQPPVVRIVSPANGATFFAPVNIPLYAYASDPDGSVASVEFFAGTNSLGLGQRVPVATPLADGAIIIGGPVPPIYPTNLFFLTWSNAPIGDYALTAKATDNDGASTISDPVKIAILPSPPPPTNRPPIVSIVATDPVAIEGTNCFVWPGETNATPTWAAWPTAVCRFFTNCGPKTATFTVRRFGDTNDDVTVPYNIGGTASNGVDYVALPDSVTIPAGERCALITIVPIDDGPPDVNKTVILTLLPDMQVNPLPGYVLGFPRCAAAIIIDSDGPRPVTAVLPDKCFHLFAPGPDAASFCIQYSTDLVNWTSICTNQVVNGSIDFVDPDAQSNSSRFYRTVSLTTVPSD